MPIPEKKLALPKDVQDRIRLEEQFRFRVRAEQEDEDQKKSNSGFFAFLQTKLGLVILTSILVPALGGLYAHVQEKRVQRTAMNQEIIKLTAEFDLRLAEIQFHRNRIPTEDDHSKYVSGTFIWSAIVGGAPEFKLRYFPTRPEFEHVHLIGILSQLRSLGFPDPNDQAFKTIKEMESGNERVKLANQPPNEDHTYNLDVLDGQLKVLQDFRSHVSPHSGLWGLIW